MANFQKEKLAAAHDSGVHSADIEKVSTVFRAQEHVEWEYVGFLSALMEFISSSHMNWNAKCKSFQNFMTCDIKSSKPETLSVLQLIVL